MLKKSFCLLCIIFLFSFNAKAQDVTIEPPFWWVGMQDTTLQLLIHGDKIRNLKPEINYENIKISFIYANLNENYLVITIGIPKNTKPGIFKINFKKENTIIFTYDFELKKRRENSANRKGFSQNDILYMLMPDRFSNGDSTNDNRPGMPDKADRSNPDGRHGGDIAGISNHLDYFKNLGISTLWINPLLENNMPYYSYHGYAITDFYKVDARFGNNADYINLVKNAHKKNLKVIQDMVFNHCGSNHIWQKDLPHKEWFNNWPEFTRSNYRSETLMDPHASSSDIKLMSNGWFDNSMPDLNQKLFFVANYLIQNSIWWIEYANLDGIRMDTYPYSDQDFMRNWVQRIKLEYPNFTILGEVWLQSEAHTAYFQSHSMPFVRPNSDLRSVTDFPLMYAIQAALNEVDGWTEGLAKIYINLSKDFLYAAPDSNVIFLDNHDVTRITTVYHNDFNKYKMAMGLLMTLRGIPLIYYGTEIMMTGDKKDGDGGLREDFPGGWKNDSVDVFNDKNLSKQQSEALEFTRTLLKIRNENLVLQTGKLTHYIPKKSVYVYFRYDDNQIFMIVLNNSDSERILDLSRFSESMESYNTIENQFTKETLKIENSLHLDSKSFYLFKLK